MRYVIAVAVLLAAILGVQYTDAAGQEYRLTYYTQAEFGGQPLACGSDIYGTYNSSDPTTIATDWNTFGCGDRLRVCTDGGCIAGIVKDRCGGCGAYHLDLSEAGYNILGGYSYGTVEKLGDYSTLTGIEARPTPTIIPVAALPDAGNGGYLQCQEGNK